jgi:hypothetical protein
MSVEGKMTNTLISPVPVTHTLEDGTVFSEKSRRCIRGIPIGRSVWLPGDGPDGEPKYANDNHKGGRWPLMEEYQAGRLGKCDSEGKILMATARWFADHYSLANRPADACRNQYRTVSHGELGEYVDFATADSTNPDGIQFDRDPIQRLFGVDQDTIPAYGRDLEALIGVEHRVRSKQICQHLMYRLDCNYRHVVEAVINHAEMKDIAKAEGASGAVAGRMFVRAGLRTASLVRLDLHRWEGREKPPIGPLPDKPGVYSASVRKAANDDMRHYVRDVA